MSAWLRLRVAASFAAAVATVIAMAAGAAAHHTDTNDPNDAGGLLDVREVRFDHDAKPFWTVKTFSKWSIRRIWDQGYVIVFLDTREGPNPEYYLLVRSTGTRLDGSLWRARAFSPDSRLGEIETRRLSQRSVSMQVRLNRLEFGKRTWYRWWVHTTFTGDVCPRSCHDRVPSDRDLAIEQWRPGESPSPSPSLSP